MTKSRRVRGRLFLLLVATMSLVPFGGPASETRLRIGTPRLRLAEDSPGPRQAEFWSRVAEDRKSRGDLLGAVTAYRTAIEGYRMEGKRKLEVETLNSQGRVLRLLGDFVAARVAYNRALAIAREIGFLQGEAVALNNLGMIGYFMGESDQALPAFRRALAIWIRLKDQARAATTLNNIGSTYLLAGRIEDATVFFQRSLRLAQTAGERSAEATALTELGWAHYLRQEYRQAIELYERAIEIRRASGDGPGEAGALDRLGSAFRELGDIKRAERAYRRALVLLSSGGSRLDEAHTLNNLCQLGLAAGGHPDGESCERALALFRQGGDRNGQAHALYLKARMLERSGRLGEAVRVNEQALDLLDALWSRAEGKRLRTSYLETRQAYFEFHLSLLMELQRRDPDHGFDIQALQASERARSRNLLEALLESRLARDEHGALIEALSRGRSLDIRELRSHALAPGTQVLVYAVGDQASFLWWMSRDAMGSTRLPGRRELESAISKVRRLLADSKADPVQTFLALDSLGRVVLGPKAARQGYSRWIVIPDGPLYYVPFGALSLPEERERSGSPTELLASWRPLLVGRNITIAPSLSVLGLLQETPRVADRTIAVFADPVFSSRDPRVTGALLHTGRETLPDAMGEPPIPESLADLRRSAGEFHLQNWRRLPGSRMEALRIRSLVLPRENFVALDFSASRQIAMNREMSRYRILHFATHGLLNERYPELSAIVLSLVDESGRPVNGFLRAADVLSLRLSADLVVLSGCRTALGRETRGEGLVGLTQAFLIAGARSLLVSLWDVDDRATSELMARFYKNLLGRRLPPSAALRAAQMSLLADERWRAPYYWAAFALVGEGDRQALLVGAAEQSLQARIFSLKGARKIPAAR